MPHTLEQCQPATRHVNDRLVGLRRGGRILTLPPERRTPIRQGSQESPVRADSEIGAPLSAMLSGSSVKMHRSVAATSSKPKSQARFRQGRRNKDLTKPSRNQRSAEFIPLRAHACKPTLKHMRLGKRNKFRAPGKSSQDATMLRDSSCKGPPGQPRCDAAVDAGGRR